MVRRTNSRITRVIPVFGWLKKNLDSDWPSTLLKLADGITEPIDCGRFKHMDLDVERKVPATHRRLAWMLENAERLAPRDGRRWNELRERVADKVKARKAIAALKQETKKSISNTLKLEGVTHADCLIECERAFIWIEGKRNDWLDPSIQWDLSRDQLARNLEAVWTVAKRCNKDYCVLICHEYPLKHHEVALVEGYRSCTWSAGLPHVSETQRNDFSRRIGTVSWTRIVEQWSKLRDHPKLKGL
jgi:hypothetical protein